MKNVNKVAKICCIVCAVLMLAVLVLQYMPYWSFDTDSSSIADYLWWPDHHKALTKELRGILGRDFEVRLIAPMPLIVLLAGILGMIVCVWKPGKVGSFIFPLIAGATAVIGFLTVPAFSLGSTYIVQIVVSALLIITAISGGIFSIMNMRTTRALAQ